MPKITLNQAKKFLNEITRKNKVAIIHHDDADGYISATLLLNFLKNKKTKTITLQFNINKSSFKNYNLKKFDTIIITDLAPSTISKDLHLIKHKKILYIDHHPKSTQIPKQILEYRTKSEISSAKTTYNLVGGNELFQIMAQSVDAGWKQKENRKIINKFLKKNNMTFQQFNRQVGYKFVRTIDYFHKKPNKAFKILKSLKNLKDLNKLNKYDQIVGKEIKKLIKQYKTKKQKIGNINFFHFKPKYPIKSSIINEISYTHPKQTYIFATPMANNKKITTLSARNQTQKINMAQLLKTGIKNLKNASAGGHIPAAGGSIQTKDLNKFKQNLKNRKPFKQTSKIHPKNINP
jgi:single-stranded DNA-specific DHH superfamily exonuclease